MKHRLTLLLAPKCPKNLYFNDFPIQMYGAIGQKHVTLYPGMLPRVFGLEIAHLALSQHPDGMIKKSQIVLFVNIKVKVRSGCVSDRHQKNVMQLSFCAYPI